MKKFVATNPKIPTTPKALKNGVLVKTHFPGAVSGKHLLVHKAILQLNWNAANANNNALGVVSHLKSLTKISFQSLAK